MSYKNRIISQNMKQDNHQSSENTSVTEQANISISGHEFSITNI